MSSGEGQAGSPDPRLREEILEARHQLLTMRDHVVGTEAEVGRLNRDLALALAQARKFAGRVAIVKGRRDEVRTRARRLARREVALTRELAAARQRIEELEAQLASRHALARRVVRRLRGRAK